MKIVNLLDYPNYIEEVAYLLYNQWQKNSENWLSLEDTIKRTKKIYNSKKWCPSILIALDNDMLCWTVSLWISDIPERQDLFPFLASLYVKPEYRKRWIATKLVFELEKLAKLKWWYEIYLYDDSNIKWFYDRLWYSFVEEDSYKWYIYKIYKKIL